ncbi:MAG: transposase [Victivallales bacterium]|nr:transposase [Victivallales bacterium]
MPRLPRVYIQGSLYYITCRGLPSQNIFREKEDYEMYFSLMKKYKEELGFKLYAYALMPSHLHLLLEMDTATSISTIMHNLNSSYTKYFNNRYQHKGHLLRERFKAAVIEKDPQLLLKLSAYIHLNCRRLNMAVQARTYPYSSYSLYLDYTQQGDRGLNIKNEIADVVGALLGQNYADFAEQLEQSPEYQYLHKQLQRNRMAGSDAFIEKVKQEIENQKQQNETADARSGWLGQPQRLVAGTVVLIIALTAAGVYIYFDLNRKPQSSVNESVSVLPVVLRDLDKTEWQIQLFDPDGKMVNNDIITFQNNKITSAYLAQLNFPSSNFSMVMEGDRVIWETMQTSAGGTASWRGEVENGIMTGIMSLRQEGQIPQDFSFKSLTYRRK